MDLSREQLLGRAVRTRLVRLVRDHAGAFPGEEIFDLHSPGGFLAYGLARESPRWRVHAGVGPTEASLPNLEPVELTLPELPFEDESLALVTAAFLDGPFAAWGGDLVSELDRVLLPKGRLLFVVRGPSSRAPGIERTLPDGARDELKDVGLLGVAQRRMFYLLDGSEIFLVEATKTL